MVSTFHGLELGKRGLMVGQASIATTGHNISNANTKGYSRQQVNGVSAHSLEVLATGNVNPSQLGSGVSLESITRVRDRFLDQQYRDQSGTLGEWSIKQDTLDQLETIVNEPSETGLRASMDQLAGAWEDLANDPGDQSATSVLIERAQQFIDIAQSMDRTMTELKSVLGEQLTAKTAEADSLLTQIAELNKSILRAGKNANDLLDKRDVAVEQLSKLADVKVTEQTNGTYSISLPDGTTLVSGDKVEKTMDVSKLGSGELTGLKESIAIVDRYQGQLTELVKDFAVANGMTASTEPSLFIGDATNFKIASLKVNQAISKDNPPQVNVAGNPKEAGKAYQAVVSKLGAESQSAMNYVANFDASLQATEGRRQSVTGISLDEEMANLIKFQHAYSAAARMISTTDQMLDTIINRMAAR